MGIVNPRSDQFNLNNDYGVLAAKPQQIFQNRYSLEILAIH